MEDVIETYMPINVLEIGGGQQPLSAEFLHMPIQVVLVDPATPVSLVDNSQIEIIRTQLSESLLMGRKFDAVIAAHVISYLNSKENFLNDLVSLLRPQGVGVVVLHEDGCPQLRLMQRIRSLLGLPEIHLITSSYLVSLLRQSVSSVSVKRCISHWRIPCEVLVRNREFFFHCSGLSYETVLNTLRKEIDGDEVYFECWNALVVFERDDRNIHVDSKSYWDFKHRTKPFEQNETLLANEALELVEQARDYCDNARLDVLDLCCGQGEDTAFFARKEHVAVGVDISNVAIQIAKRKYSGVLNIRFVCDDIIPFLKCNSKKYDLIFSLQVDLQVYATTRQVPYLCQYTDYILTMCSSLFLPSVNQ